MDHVLEQYSGLRGARIAVVRPLGAVVGQDSLLTQALSNLITNAIKFSPLESQPSVTIRAERKSGRVRIVVEDEGIGIPPAQLAKLFTPFVKLHPESEYEGTGIGLAIVKKAVERMGGTAGAESEPGRGRPSCSPTTIGTTGTSSARRTSRRASSIPARWSRTAIRWSAISRGRAPIRTAKRTRSPA